MDEVVAQEWVSAAATRNYMARNPLMDWLNIYGTNHGFKQDDELPGYDPRTDFTSFILSQGVAFEAAVTRHLATKISILTISRHPGDIRSRQKAQETAEAMKAGYPLIAQGVLQDPNSQTYGAPDFLMRSDVLNELFPGTCPPEEVAISAPGLQSDGYHYRVVDIKFTTLDLNSNELLANNGSSPAYKAQLFIYNRALGAIQGYLPPLSYLLGRSWRQTKRGETIRGTNCMDRLAPCDMTEAIGGQTLEDWVDCASGWLRKVRSEGGSWEILPEPSVPELWPNMGEVSDFPWHAAKTHIGKSLSDLTLFWQVGPDKRDRAHKFGVKSWKDPRLTPGLMGIRGANTAPTLRSIIEVNRDLNSPMVLPEKVRAAEEERQTVPPLEFYVDFETVSDLADDFSGIPERGGQALIFMIGCGHMEEGQWLLRCFVADDLTELSEQKIIANWLDHIAEVKRPLNLESYEPKVIHWSGAETGALETNYNGARARHQHQDWPKLNWFDFLTQVVREEPVVVRGAMGFGLKDMAQAMFNLGLIDTSWEQGPGDGLGAMVGAWSCAEEATKLGCTLMETDLMQGVAAYNEVDCKVMMEIVRFLRARH